MAARLGPVDAVAGSPAFSGRAWRQTMLGPVLAGATTARPLGAQSGVRPGTAQTIVTATSTTWTVTPFAGVIDAETAAEAGPYGFAFDTNQTGSVNAAHATWPRWDILSVQIDDQAEADGTSTPAVRILYTAGTAASSPAEPAVPARAMRICRIVVPQSGGGSPSVVWLAPVAVAAGGIYPNPSSSQKAALDAIATATNPIWIDDAGTLARSVGAGWVVSAWPRTRGEWRLAANQSIPSGAFTLVGAATASGTVDGGLSNTAGAITLSAAGNYTVTVDARWAASVDGKGYGIFVTVNAASIDGAGTLSGGATVGRVLEIAGGSTGIAQTVTSPSFAAAAGDVVRVFVFQTTGGAVNLDQGLTAQYLGVTRIVVTRVG